MNVINKKSISLFGTYVIWITLHYFSAHIYANYCTPLSIDGYILSPFIVNTPPCQSLRWVINQGANTITNLWVILGTWLTSYLLIKDK